MPFEEAKSQAPAINQGAEGVLMSRGEVWECAKKRYARRWENWAGLGVLTL